MKTTRRAAILAALSVLILTLVACSSKPSWIDGKLYEIKTNHSVVITQTNGVFYTNVVETVHYAPKPGVEAVISTGGGIAGGWLGLGGLVSTVLVGAYHAYAQIRNKKVSAALVQGIETAREVLKTTPKGKALDARLVNFLASQQKAEGVIAEVAKSVDKNVDNQAAVADAKLVVDSSKAISATV